MKTMMRSFAGAGVIALLAMALLMMMMIGDAEAAVTGAPSVAVASPTALVGGINCGKECNRRCSQTWRRKDCLHFCNMCCAKCKCVPSGYSGNKGECPCYSDWKNKRGGPKCP